MDRNYRRNVSCCVTDNVCKGRTLLQPAELKRITPMPSNSVNRSTGIMLPPPPMKYAVDVKATGNDPVQKVKVNGKSVTISGAARNNGIVASFVQLTVEGKKISVPTGRGMSPMQTV